jgi:hypothetical protein
MFSKTSLRRRKQMTEHDGIGFSSHGGFEVHGEQYIFFCVFYLSSMNLRRTQLIYVPSRTSPSEGLIFFRTVTFPSDRQTRYIPSLFNSTDFHVIKSHHSCAKHVSLTRGLHSPILRMFLAYSFTAGTLLSFFPQHRVHGTAQHLAYRALSLFCIGFRFFRIVREF